MIAWGWVGSEVWITHLFAVLLVPCAEGSLLKGIMGRDFRLKTAYHPKEDVSKNVFYFGGTKNE